jgi:hypothetical protein
MLPLNSFAYTTDMDDSNIVSIAPLYPWVSELDLPTKLTESRNSILISRTISNQVELWFKINLFNSYLPDYSTEYQFAIYNTSKKTWEYISSEVGNSGVYINNLFVTSDGSIWGQNIKDENSNSTDNTPVLSKFNEIKRVFEFVEITMQIPSFQKEKILGRLWFSKVYLDNQDIFWVFVHNDAIYTLDSRSSLIERHIEISNIVTSVTSTPNGGVYFKSDRLYKYVPEENEITSIYVRLEPFPEYQSILLDQKDRLWFDNLGWLDSDERTWFQIHRSPLFITNVLWSNAEYRWKSGFIQFESSNGLIWFYSENGMISLDPEKGEWCWFTTYQSNIVEDSDRNLWMIADNKLYKLPLGEQ